MATASLRRHPALQFWPRFWASDDGALATFILVRDEGLTVLCKPDARGDRVPRDVFRWAANDDTYFVAASIEDNREMRESVLDGRAWIEIWTLWPWGWSRDTSVRPCSESPSASELDAAARIVEGLPLGLPVVPGRWLPNVVVKREAVPCGGA